MIFTFKTAEKIIGFYKHLIGKPFKSSISGLEIINIVIAPEDDGKFEVFIEEMQTTTDYNKALSVTGYNPNRVKLVLMASHTQAPDIRVNQELDQYLRRNHMERVYLNPYYFED
ncbi:MAG: hypothetical protein V4561_03800 [Bacteroidota bacterium]|jgi:hypothetical protein